MIWEQQISKKKVSVEGMGRKIYDIQWMDRTKIMKREGIGQKVAWNEVGPFSCEKPLATIMIGWCLLLLCLVDVTHTPMQKETRSRHGRLTRLLLKPISCQFGFPYLKFWLPNDWTYWSKPWIWTSGVSLHYRLVFPIWLVPLPVMEYHL